MGSCSWHDGIVKLCDRKHQLPRWLCCMPSVGPWVSESVLKQLTLSASADLLQHPCHLWGGLESQKRWSFLFWAFQSHNSWWNLRKNYSLVCTQLLKRASLVMWLLDSLLLIRWGLWAFTTCLVHTKQRTGKKCPRIHAGHTPCAFSSDVMPFLCSLVSKDLLRAQKVPWPPFISTELNVSFNTGMGLRVSGSEMCFPKQQLAV